jgi:arylsulfatase A-like enzyme
VSHLLAALLPGAASALLLLIKSVLHYTRGGPKVPEEVIRRFHGHAILWLLILTFWAFVIASAHAAAGVALLALGAALAGFEPGFLQLLAAGVLALVVGVFRAFCRTLLHTPSSLTVSLQYRINRLYPLWRWLSPGRLAAFDAVLAAVAVLLVLANAWRLAADGRTPTAALLLLAGAVVAGCLAWCAWHPPIRPRRVRPRRDGRPNILLFGADTLRADRLGAAGYHRDVTPCIDTLAARGTLFTNCYVPLARTAPSLASLLTGMWPHHHGIRENFVPDGETGLPVPALPEILKAQGYRSVAVSDWSGADLGKLRFHYDECDLPTDQWNLKYYLSQGPMDLRLFLTLFTHSRFGRTFLPQLYYLAGVPLTRELGDRTLLALNRLAGRGEPFLLTTFMGTTHVPYGSEYPWYLRYSTKEYDGDSKFVVSRLADPMEIIEMQEAERSRFDVPQILNLYDACVARFDAELARVLAHLEATGLAEETIVVVFSDHGTDFFENHTWGQGNTVLGSDPSARVPLLILDPRERGAGPVHRIVRTIDLVPTLLDLLGLPPPGPLPMDGVSLLPYLRGSRTDLALPAFQETGVWLGRIPGRHPQHLSYPNVLELLEVPDARTGTLAFKARYADIIIEARDRMIRTEDWKLVYLPLERGALWQLFDLRADPACQHDVASRHPRVLAELKAALVAWIEQDRARRFEAEHVVRVASA